MHIPEFQKYLKFEKHYSDHTCLSYSNDLQQFQIFIEAQEVTLQEVSYSYVRQWMMSLMEDGITARSVNRKMSSLKAYFKFLKVKAYSQENVMALHKSLKTSKKVQVPFTQLEVLKVLEQPIDDTSFEGVRDRAIIELLYVTGMRRAELIGLTLNRVDIEKGRIQVLGKRNKERIIPLLQSSKDRLIQYLELRSEISNADGEVFFVTSKGKSLYPSLVYRLVTNYFKQVSAKVKVSPHVLRHTFATHLLDQGADLNSVKELLGHASLASTQVYTHTSMAALKRVHATAHPRNKSSR